MDWRRTHGSPVSAFVLYERPIWFHSTTYFSRRLRCLTNSMWINFHVLLHQLKSATDVLLAMGRVLLHDVVSCETGAHVWVLINQDRCTYLHTWSRPCYRVVVCVLSGMASFVRACSHSCVHENLGTHSDVLRTDERTRISYLWLALLCG